MQNYTRFEWRRCKNTLETSGEDQAIGRLFPLFCLIIPFNIAYSNITTTYLTQGETTLETGGEDVKLHSKRVGKMWNYTRNEWGRCKTTLETSVKVQIFSGIKMSRVLFNFEIPAASLQNIDVTGVIVFTFLFETLLFPKLRTSGKMPCELNTLVPSVVLHLLHPFRV